MVFTMIIGPQLTALITDFVFSDPAYLAQTMSITAVLVMPVSAFLLWRALPQYRDSVARLAQAAERLDRRNLEGIEND